MPRVINIRSIRGVWPENTVRVDRRSRWGNHFIMRNDSDKERDRVCDAYEKWLQERPAMIDRAKRELRGKDLACWCAPKRCHAETLLRIANED